MNWLYLFLAIVAEVIATLALRGAEGFTKLVPSLIAIVGYAVAFYLLSLTMKTIPVGISYAIWSGVGIVLVSVLALWIFNQTLDKPAVLGMAMILGGVLIINLFSKSITH
jgi:Membrane transporters of cations and cationic drugs